MISKVVKKTKINESAKGNFSRAYRQSLDVAIMDAKLSKKTQTLREFLAETRRW